MDELEANAPPIASQLDIYAKMKHLQSQMVKMQTEIINMKRQIEKKLNIEGNLSIVLEKVSKTNKSFSMASPPTS